MKIMDKTEAYTCTIIVLLLFGLLGLIMSYGKDKSVDNDFHIEHFNGHSFISNYILKCFIHDPDCQCGGIRVRTEFKKVP